MPTPMIGHGSPRTLCRLAASLVAATVATACAVSALAAEVDVRLRVAWGSNALAPQTWSGEIQGQGLTLAQLQPLGVEADEAAALRLVDNRLVIAPLVPRVFDGCDVTIHGDDQQLVTIRLHNSPPPKPRRFKYRSANWREPSTALPWTNWGASCSSIARQATASA
jgi:hypothetical protein